MVAGWEYPFRHCKPPMPMHRGCWLCRVWWRHCLPWLSHDTGALQLRITPLRLADWAMGTDAVGKVVEFCLCLCLQVRRAWYGIGLLTCALMKFAISLCLRLFSARRRMILPCWSRLPALMYADRTNVPPGLSGDHGFSIDFYHGPHTSRCRKLLAPRLDRWWLAIVVSTGSWPIEPMLLSIPTVSLDKK